MPAPVPPSAETALLAELLSRAQELARQARAENTLRAYRSDWRDFAGWCRDRSFPSCPASPHAVALYLTALSRTHKVSTLTRRLSALSQAHQTAGFPSPTEETPVRLLMAGIRRSLGTAAAAKRPVLV
ncbi:MAG: site-specific integrase, partial [Bryobacteraceae bacterium]